MSNSSPLPWIAVSGYMNESYRQYVIETALTHLPKASSDLRHFASKHLTEWVKIPGFRPNWVGRAPVSSCASHVAKAMLHNNLVATSIICLWAEAKQTVIDEIRRGAETLNIQCLLIWNWQDGSDGFFPFDAGCQELDELTGQMIQGRIKRDQDDLKLGALWLSAAFNTEILSSTQQQAINVEKTAYHAQSSVGIVSLDEIPVAEETHTNIEAKIEVSSSSEVSVLDIQHPNINIPLHIIELELQHESRTTEVYYQKVLTDSTYLLQFVQNSNYEQAANSYAQLGSNLHEWRVHRSNLQNLLSSTYDNLIAELDLRKDLKQEFGSLLKPETKGDIDLTPIVEYITETISRITNYDDQKKQLLELLDRMSGESETIHLDLLNWREKPFEDSDSAYEQLGNFSEATLLELQQTVRDAEQNLDNLRRRLHSLSVINVNHISHAMSECAALAIPADTIVWDKVTFASLVDIEWVTWPIAQRQTLQFNLERLLEEHHSYRQGNEIGELANRLSIEWNDEELVELLSLLAEHKLDIEALLLLMAANVVHTRSHVITLSSKIVDTLFSGLEKFAPESNIYALLHLFAVDFVSGWRTDDDTSRLRLCIAFLMAQYAGPQTMPDGFLWTIESEWPAHNMPSWIKLWQAARDGYIPIIDVDDESKELAYKVMEKRQQAKHAFNREKTGSYSRARSVIDRKYRALLNEHMLPEAEKFLPRLIDLESEFENASIYDRQTVIQKLQTVCGNLELLTTDENIKDLFEHALTAAKLTNYHPFHERTTLSHVRDALNTLQMYAVAILEFWSYQVAHVGSIKLSDLEHELELIFHNHSNEYSLIQSLIRSIQTPQSKLAINILADRTKIIETELLSREIYTRRIPRVVAVLTNTDFHWHHILKCLLDDLANPTDSAEAAAQLLIENTAPNQVLYLSDSISLDKQKQANAIHSDQSRIVDRLVVDLIRLGETPVDYEQARQLGRWKLIKEKLTEQIELLRNAKAKKQRKLQDQATTLRNKINDLDGKIFAYQHDLGEEAFATLESSLNEARRLLSKSDKLVQVEELVSDIEYRVTHKSWTVSDLKATLTALTRVSVSNNATVGPIQNVEEVLELIRSGALQELGPNMQSLESTKFETRRKLLEEWLYLRDEVTEVRGERLSQAAKVRIQSLYRHFALMMSMKFAPTERGEARYENPVVYSVYQLEYPRTAALNGFCTFAVIPGKQTSPKHLEEFDELIAQHGWLAHDSYIIVFIPGCTKSIHNRLRSRYNGMVIIDTETLLDLVLAEKKSSNPIARLRPLMLNAKGGNVDIFTVNQLVQSRTSIFVGRDNLINRIVSSGDNYVIYGGRRIGKSSVLQEIQHKLQRPGNKVIYHSFEGDGDCSDNASARRLAKKIELEREVNNVDELKPAIQGYLDKQPAVKLTLLLDEIDLYIHQNRKRHVLIQTLRALSDQYHDQFRVIVAGFMKLYDHIKGRGPYTPSSDPWIRMFNDSYGPLANLQPAQAEKIVEVGFQEILGWSFESYRIPQIIVSRTGSHPAFVQFFCMNIQKRVVARDDKIVRINDIDVVFDDESPSNSFIAHVKDTLTMNIEDPFGRYLLLYLAVDNKDANRFLLAQAQECAELFAPLVSNERLKSNLERLTVTGVIREVRTGVYEFTVPDYPLILDRLGDTTHMNELERQING